MIIYAHVCRPFATVSPKRRSKTLAKCKNRAVSAVAGEIARVGRIGVGPEVEHAP